MKILRLKAENFKRLEVVEIVPKGPVVKLSGANKAGKSSVLDAIIAVLGGKSLRPSRPIRNGEHEAKVTLDIGGERVEHTLTLEFVEGQLDKLTIIPMRKGFTAQKFCDYLVNAISFDPLHFAGLKPKEQFDILKRIVPLVGRDGQPLDPEEIDFQNKQDYELRSQKNAIEKRLDAEHAAIKIPQETPDVEVDVSALVKQISEASRHNAEIEVAAQRREDAKRTAQRNEEAATKRIQELERLMAEARTNLSNAISRLAELEKQTDAPKIDVTDIQKQVDSAQEINRNVANKLKRKELTKQSLEARFASDDLTARMEERTAAKMEALAKAKFPVPGLAFGDNEVLYGGLPFEQASTAEKLTVSLAIGMHSNSELKVMLIKEGTLLDKTSFAIVEKMAANWDGQIWCEVVDTSETVGIVMKDGHVAKVNE